MPKIANRKVTGPLVLKDLGSLLENEYEFLDILEAEMGIDEEQWEVCLGRSHSGPVYGNSGWRKVEVLKRLLEQINSKTILLPDDVQRRHINAAKKNPHIKELQVSPNCPLFAYEDGKLMNKKKTKPVFGCKAYTVTGVIRGTWDSYETTVDVLLSDAEVEQIKKLVADANTDNFLYILKGKMSKLYKFLDWHFYDIAYKEKVSDGRGYGLSRSEAENVCMTGREYEVFVPEEFEEN
jgi:hypothetical protein